MNLIRIACGAAIVCCGLGCGEVGAIRPADPPGELIPPPTMPAPQPRASMLCVKIEDVAWERYDDDSVKDPARIAVLHVDPVTKATRLLIRVPPNYHVPRHWHSANETHTVVTGTFTMECMGKKVEMGPGSFNFTPARMIHEAWTGGQESILFITTDGAWDMYVVPDPAPTRPN